MPETENRSQVTLCVVEAITRPLSRELMEWGLPSSVEIIPPGQHRVILINSDLELHQGVEAHLRRLLDVLESKLPILDEATQRATLNIRFHAVKQGGWTFEAEDIERLAWLAKRGIEVVVSIDVDEEPQEPLRVPP